jgi:hypothetical protein
MLNLAQALPSNLRCPRCQTHFRAAADGSTAVTRQAALPLAPRATAVAPPIARPRNKTGLGVRLGLLAGVCAGVFLFLLLGAGLLAYCLWEPAATTDTADHTVPIREARQLLPLQPVAFVKRAPGKSQGVGSVLPGQPSPDQPPGTTKGVVALPPPPANQREIDEAIARAVAWLKGKVDAAGRFAGVFGERLGASALVGLTLLSCGVPADDPAVAAITQRVRAEGGSEIQTYHLSCCIWFLDKLGNAGDKSLIRKMALQLVASQTVSGGWSYTGPLLPAEQANQLMTALESKDPSAEARQQWPVLRFSPGQPLATNSADFSNTQFAVLALWTAQKHGVPVSRSLAMADAGFRQHQAPEGWWAYRAGRTACKDSMTCAGLVALAAGQGSQGAVQGKPKPEQAAPVKDEQIDRALSYLGKRLAQLKPSAAAGQRSSLHAEASGELCFLWCVERVGVLFDLETIGGQNWFAWGSNILLQWQRADGTWEDNNGPVIDTCFALLFLQRVNVAHDLTEVLQGMGGVRDPGGKPGKAPTRAAVTAETKVIPTIRPGASKLRSDYALPPGQPPATRTRRRKKAGRSSRVVGSGSADPPRP